MQQTVWRIWNHLKALRLRGAGERVCPDQPDIVFQGHMEVYRFMAQFVTGKAVLDVGCGTGYGSDFLLRQGARTVCGIDYSRKAITYARKHFDSPGLAYRRMNAEVLEFPAQSFDVVTSSENLEHLPHPEKNVAEIRRVLAPGGLLLLGTPNKEISSPGMKICPNIYHLREFTFEDLDALLRRQFSSVHIFETTFAGEEESRRLKAERRQRGRIGLEPHGQAAIQLGPFTVDLTHLANSHSFLAMAW
jgi:2-polyprenyl-3-methyl-5-hydroxy-6-metoxy-1,4-benzoquinol methylase